MAKVSIIVPIFNQQDRLERCLDSLTNQTLQELEIILVNDGSTDDSLKICQRRQMSDPRIIVIDQPNQGVAKARNHGLAAATGEFIGFVDSDDWVEPEMFETMVRDCERTASEAAICNYYLDKGPTSHPVQLDLGREILTGTEIFTELILNMLAADVSEPGHKPIKGACFRLLVRKSMLDRHALAFPQDVHYMEDLVFSVRLLSRTGRICISEPCLYHYSVSMSSASKKYIPCLFEQLLQIMDLLTQALEEAGLSEASRTRLAYRMVFCGLRSIANEAHPANPKKLADQVLTIRKILKDPRLQEALRLPEYRTGPLRSRLLFFALRHRKAYLLLLLYRHNVRKFQHRPDRESFISN